MTMLEEVSLGAGFVKLCHLNSHSAYWLSEGRDEFQLSVAVTVLGCCVSNGLFLFLSLEW